LLLLYFCFFYVFSTILVNKDDNFWSRFLKRVKGLYVVDRPDTYKCYSCCISSIDTVWCDIRSDQCQTWSRRCSTRRDTTADHDPEQTQVSWLHRWV